MVRSLQQAPRRVSMHADGKHWPAAQGRAAFARAGLSCRRRGLGKRTDSGLGRPPELGFEGYARVIVSWVWVSRFGVLQVSAGSAQIVSACEKLYSSIAVSKN